MNSEFGDKLTRIFILPVRNVDPTVRHQNCYLVVGVIHRLHASTPHM